jgi:ribonuclease P protein component
VKNSSKKLPNNSQRLLPEQRIREPRAFKIIFENAATARGAFFKIWSYMDLNHDFKGRGPKIGMMVSRKTHLRAVVRNQWKRRIRESFRRMQAAVRPECLVIVSTKHGQVQAPEQKQIAEELRKLLSKTGSLV